MFISGSLWWAVSHLFKKSFFMFHVRPIFTLHGEDFSSICFCRCLVLGRVGEYSHVTKVLQPITLAIPFEDTIVALH
jgi:hypothetical protein